MKQPDDDAGSGSGVVLLSGECRPLRRALRPLVWVVLEEVALDAVVEDGQLVARTSARHVAERLGVNPSTAAEALRVLGRRGLVGLEREKGPAGRFGLSVYQSARRPGSRWSNHVRRSHTWCHRRWCSGTRQDPWWFHRVWLQHRWNLPGWRPQPVGPAPRPLEETTRPTSVTSGPDGSGATLGEGSPGRPGRSTASPGSSQHCPGQEALDLGWGSSS